MEIIIILFSSLSGTSVGGTCFNWYISLSIRVYYFIKLSFLIFGVIIRFLFVCAVSTKQKSIAF